MTDETKAPPKAPDAPATPAASDPGPSAPPAAAPPSAPKAPPPAPKPPVKPEPWSNPLLDLLQKNFPSVISDAVIFRNMPSITVAKDSMVAVCEFLKSEDGGAYTFLTDLTAVDYPKREKRFEVILHLYSFNRNDRLKVKANVGEGEKALSVSALWAAANWLEREVYDMFGVGFEGHPNLKRILLPDEWVGHPLRKDYDIMRQDDAWVQANLHIKSGQ